MSAVAAPIAMVATAIGAGIQAYGAKETGAYQQQMYQYQAGTNMAIAGAERQQAELIRGSGEVAAQQVGLQTRGEMGRTVAAGGASGISIASPSTQGVLKSEQALGYTSEAQARTGAAFGAYGKEAEAAQAVAQAGAETVAGKQAVVAGDIGALGSIVSGVGSVAKQWYSFSSGSGGGSDPNSFMGATLY